MEHTPWKVAKSAIVYTDTGPFLEDAAGTTIGRIFSGDDFSIAEFVARAVNIHCQLLEALEGLKCWDCEYPLTQPDYAGCYSCKQARAAIEEARK